VASTSFLPPDDLLALAVDSPSLSILQRELIKFYFLDDLTRNTNRVTFNRITGRDLTVAQMREELAGALVLLRGWFHSHGVEDFRDLL
jgi:hypothetical protein